MQFESQAKADNFIKFNSETMMNEDGWAPVRSYYCAFCACWHVTSNSSLKSAEHFDNLYNKEIEALKKPKKQPEKKEKFRPTIEQSEYFKNLHKKIDTIFELLVVGDIEGTNEVFESCKVELENIPLDGRQENITKANAKMQLIETILEEVKRLIDSDEAIQLDYISKTPHTDAEKYVAIFLTNYRSIQAFNNYYKIFQTVDTDEEIKQYFELMSQCVEKIKGPYSSDMRKKLNSMINILRNNYQKKKNYNELMLYLIEKLESGFQLIEKKEYGKCWNIVYDCNQGLERFKEEDENTKLITSVHENLLTLS